MFSQLVKYDVHTTSKIKHTRHFYHILLYIIIFIQKYRSIWWHFSRNLFDCVHP